MGNGWYAAKVSHADRSWMGSPGRLNVLTTTRGVGGSGARAVLLLLHKVANPVGLALSFVASQLLACDLGNPLTTSNVAHEKSRIGFLGLPGGIFLKMLF